MPTVEERKVRLEQKKNRLAAEEIRINILDRKSRTRCLIEKGGLIAKAGLDTLPVNALYGGLLSLKQELDKNETILASWVVQGNAAFNKDKELMKHSIILKFEAQSEDEIRDLVRGHGLKWNRFRHEWYGYVNDLKALKEGLKNVVYDIEIIEG